MQRFLRWMNKDKEDIDKDDEIRYTISLNCLNNTNCCTSVPVEPPIKAIDCVDLNVQPSGDIKEDILRPKKPSRVWEIGRSCCCFQIKKRRCKELAYTPTDVYSTQSEEAEI